MWCACTRPRLTRHRAEPMSQNQLVLADDRRETLPFSGYVDTDGTPIDFEENALVDRFMDASRDLVPSVQITLAKRIIRPGSNRVVCLAAKTSIPLNDDEVASVSDLALRLSDGTNVALSLSFFNDALGGEYATNAASLNRYVYDPSHYAKKNDSGLGFVLLGMTIVVAVGVFGFTHKAILGIPEDAVKKAPLVKAATVPARATIVHTASAGKVSGKASSTTPNVAGTTSTSTQNSAAVAKVNPSAAATTIATHHTTNHSYSNGSGSNSTRTKAVNHANSGESSGSHNYGSMLVPPPPPTPYVMPYASGMPVFDPRSQSFSAPTASASSGARPKVFEVKPEAKPAPDASSIEPKTYRIRKNEFFSGVDKARSTGTGALSTAAELSVTAPQPGLDVSATPLQLERIVIPNHDSP